MNKYQIRENCSLPCNVIGGNFTAKTKKTSVNSSVSCNITVYVDHSPLITEYVNYVISFLCGFSVVTNTGMCYQSSRPIENLLHKDLRFRIYSCPCFILSSFVKTQASVNSGIV